MNRDLRRLTTIVSVDVVGYSRLMGADESGTLAALKGHLRELVDPKIGEYGGRTVKSMGDGLLLEFPSVVDAVRCAVDIQRGMLERNAKVPDELKIQFRIGINVGDIIIDGDDIFGDGVNVAARLQTLAEAGGICVSRGVRDQVLDKLSFTFEDLGAKEVKNIARPVEAFRVELGDGAMSARPALWRRKLIGRGTPWRWPIAVLALSVVGATVWIVVPHLRTGAGSGPPPALSIAVLPFTATGGTDADGKFADNLTQELTAALGEWRFATVAPFRTASAFTGKARDVHAVGRELNVRYLIEGETQHAGEQVIVSTQIIDANTGNQVWSERVTGEGPSAVKDAAEVVSQLDVRLRDALVKVESRRAGAGTGHGATAVELVLRARNIQNTATEPVAGALEAGKLYEEAIRLNPYFATALVARIDNLDTLIYIGRPSRAERDRMVTEMDELSRRALAVDDKYASAWYARALTFYWQGRLEEALDANARYGQLEQSRSTPLTQRAWFILFLGRAAEALDIANEALSRPINNAYEESYAYATRCAIELRMRRYDEAIADCRKAAGTEDWWFANALLLAAYAQKGDMTDATIVKDRLAGWRPGYSIADEKAYQVSTNPTYLQQTETEFYGGLRKAGVPEQ